MESYPDGMEECESALLYKECELYMDDILPFADSKEEMLQRLHRLFTLFREYNITLSPEKCAIRMDRVEYVGHLNKVRQYREVRGTNKYVQSEAFSGTRNYFRDHIPNFLVLAIPLQKLVVGYTKVCVIRR
jgi:hypothetical protein